MTKKEYATEVAKKVNGKTTTVNKNGVEKVGITKKADDATISPVIYIDEMYDDGMTVAELADHVEELFKANENVSIDELVPFNLNIFDEVRPHITAKLKRKDRAVEPYVSAESYGFDDLVIEPYIQLDVKNGNVGGIKVTEQLLNIWDETLESVVKLAIDNSEPKIMNMIDVMANMMGIPREEAKVLLADGGNVPMTIVTNEASVNGAFNIIKAKEALDEQFPDGYIVLPSSIHEVIVLPYSEEYDNLNNMVNEVNTDHVKPEDQLSDKAYYINV